MKTKALILSLFLGSGADGLSLGSQNHHHKHKPHHRHHHIPTNHLTEADITSIPEIKLSESVQELDTKITKGKIDFEGMVNKSM